MSKDAVSRILEGDNVREVLEDISITTSAVAQMPGHKQYKVGKIHRKKKKEEEKDA